MKRKDIITIGLLLIITTLSGIISIYFHDLKWVGITIILLSAIKFMLVSFQFMELKSAHPFWKIILLSYLTIICIIVMLLL